MADSAAETNAAAVTKAVVPAAGLGTRFMPAAKAIPKELLPVVDTPVIQHVIEEAVAAKGDDATLAQVRASNQLADLHFVRQSAPRGLGHAVLCAAEHVGDQPFAVLLADDFIDRRDPLLSRMLEVRQQRGGSVVALMEVEPDQVSHYGCVAMKPTGEGDVVTVVDMVEKPHPAQAPSNWIIIGRYVCDPAIFDVLRRTPPGRGGEIQLTDALRTLADQGAALAADGPHGEGQGGGHAGVHGVLFRGRRYDTGNKLDYLRTQIQFACEREDLAPEFIPWLRSYLDSHGDETG